MQLVEAAESRRLAVGWVGVLLGLAAVVWSFGLAGPYQFDDSTTPMGDPASQSLAAWAKHLGVTLRPVTKLTYAVEAELGLTKNPAPRRALSIAFHAASAVLLFFLLVRLEPRIATTGSALLAALWLAHPVHAESVLAVSGRTATLSGLLLISALLALERGRNAACAALFVLACLARETALAGALPLLVAAVSRSQRVAHERRKMFLLLFAALALALLWILSTPQYLRLADYSFLGRPWERSFAQQVGAVPVGLEFLVRPDRLSIDYGVPLPKSVSDPLFLLGIVLYTGAFAGVVLLRHRSRCAAIGLALWLAALLPTQSVVPKLDPLTNRPLSLALAGLLLALAPVVGSAKERFASPWFARSATAAAVLLVAGLGASAIARGRLYGSELALWADAASKSRTNARPHARYAILLKEKGRHREAWEAVSAAHEIDPFSSFVSALWNDYRQDKESP